MRAKRQPRADEASVGDSALSSLLRAANDAHLTAAREQQAEIDRLAEESGRYHAAIEALPQGVCVFDGQARLAVCNRRYADLYRLDLERLKPGVTWREIVDLRLAAQTLPLEVDDYLVLRAPMRLDEQSREWRDKLPDGRTIAVRRQALPGGGWISTHEDVTELRDQRAGFDERVSLQTLIDCLHDNLCRHLAVHHPARRDQVRARVRLRDGDRGVALKGGVVADVAGRREQAAVAVVGVLAHAQVSHDDAGVADLGAQVGQRELGDAHRVVAGRAPAVLDRGDAEYDQPAHARGRRLRGRLAQAVPSVLDDAGHRADRLRLGDAFLDEHGQHQFAGAQRGLGHEPAQGRRAAQPPGTYDGESSAHIRYLAVSPGVFGPFSAQPAAGAAAALARPPDGLPRLLSRIPQACAELGEGVDQRRHRRPGRGHVDAQPELGRGLGGLRADDPDHRDRVRLARDADQVPHGGGGGEQHGVEAAALDGLAPAQNLNPGWSLNLTQNLNPGRARRRRRAGGLNLNPGGQNLK